MGVTGWDNCSADIEGFELVSPAYTLAKVADAKKRIADAKAMPDDASRNAGYVIARQTLVTTNANLLGLWQFLKIYISKAFPEAQHSALFAAAGEGYYKRAKNNSWDNTASLITSASSFMVTYQKELTANGVMPPAFPEGFSTTATTWTEQWAAFKKKEEEAAEQSLAKFEANKAVYAELVEMCDIGRRLFKDSSEHQKKYIIKDLLYEARGKSPAGIQSRVQVADPLYVVPLAGARIGIKGDPLKFALSDKKGKYHLHVAAGTYTFEFSHPDYGALLVEKTIKVGTNSRLNVDLVPMDSLVPEGQESPAAVEEQAAPSPKEAEAPLTEVTLPENGDLEDPI